MYKLCSQPAVGEMHPGCNPQVRCTHHGRHFIFYEVHESRIRIVRVLHDRMDIVAHLLR
jgi:plasmid stabilization system protein ParE